jgi:hypothetical protein
MVLFSIVLVLGMAGAASAVTLTDVTLFTATGTTQTEEVIGDRGDKSSLSSSFLKEALSNEGPSHPMRQNYLFQTAFAIIFTLKPTIWHWAKIAKTFFVKNGQYSPKFGNSLET